jgi:tRNA-splicing ligase RtcB
MKFVNNFNVITHAYAGAGGKLNVPIKLFLDEVEDGALQQMDHLAQLPFVFHHVAGMPDMHQGYGMPIGGVMATQGYIVPNAVGVDIGCGMCAMKTNILSSRMNKKTLKKIMGNVRKMIPVGFKHHEEAQLNMPELPMDQLTIVEKEYNNARYQLGTLGGGNHFIEIQKGSDGYIWIMIHSGSRNLGHKVATHYNKVAVELNEKWKSNVPKSWQLAFLPFEDGIGQSYFKEMNYCCDFALENRKLMMSRVVEAVSKEFKDVFMSDFINIHHNYAAFENHFGKNVLVHRKGATRAYDGELGIIPGSQGTASYIVKGKGNPDSFKSCSHGAGRLMSRSKAKEVLDLQDEIKKLDDQGIVHGIRNVGDLDEASGAYKDIDVVMENQKDLVDIVVELKPLAVVKG